MAFGLTPNQRKPGQCTKEDNGHLALVRWLLEVDAADNLWFTASNGRTPLMLAAIQVCVLRYYLRM
eukprot:850064-Prorocentrum_minimum.AAC.1